MKKIYETLVGRQHVMVANKVREFFAEELIMDRHQVLKVAPGIYKINPEVTTVPQWNHPVLMEHKGELKVLIDTRSFERPDGRVVNSRELQLLLERAWFARVWELEPTAFRPAIPTLATIFAEWLIGALRRRYGASEADLETTRIYLITYFMLSAMTENELQDLRPADASEMVFRHMVRGMNRPGQFVTMVQEHEAYLGMLETIQSNASPELGVVLERLTAHLDNVAIRLDTQSLLMLVIRSSWIGHTAQELVGIGMEYPPYFYYMANQAAEVGIFRKTQIGLAVDAAKRTRVNVGVLGSLLKELKDEVFE